MGDDKIWESNEAKLLGVTTANKFKFDSHCKYLLQSQSKTKCIK